MAPSGLTKPENINFLVIFSIFHFWGWGPRKVNDLLTSPINQFRDYFIRNRLEKLVPANYRFPTDNKKNIKINRPNRFQTLTFGRNLGFQKTEICPWGSSGIIWAHLGLLKALGSNYCNTSQLKCNSRRKPSKRLGVLKVGVTKSGK